MVGQPSEPGRSDTKYCLSFKAFGIPRGREPDARMIPTNLVFDPMMVPRNVALSQVRMTLIYICIYINISHPNCPELSFIQYRRVLCIYRYIYIYRYVDR